MDLTPIKIRGRKRKHTALVASKLVSSKPSIKSASQASSQAKRLRKSKPKKKDTTPVMPTLQGLPQELLEIIFLYSVNISLPRCSSSLGRKLSSRAITMEFTMNAFFHTVDHKANIRHRKDTSDPILQSDILASRFFTYDFFLAYVQRAHDAMIELRGKAWKKTGVQVLGVTEFDGLFPFKFTRIPYLAFAEGFYIPEKLLHGPWTQDKASLLYILVSLNGEIDWEASMAGEAANTGIREALKAENEHAVAALSVLIGVPRALNTEILRYAVITCDCSIPLLRHLLFNAQILKCNTLVNTLDFYDPALWAWADANGAKGELLKDMLRKADAFNLEFYPEEDADWTKIVSFPYGGSKFDTRTAFNGVMRELLGNLYRNYGRKITRKRAMGERWLVNEM